MLKKKVFVQLLDSTPQEHTSLINMLHQASTDNQYEFLVSKVELKSIPPEQILSLVEKLLGNRNQLNDLIDKRVEEKVPGFISEALPSFVEKTIKELKVRSLIK